MIQLVEIFFLDSKTAFTSSFTFQPTIYLHLYEDDMFISASTKLNLIQEVCNSFGSNSLTSFDGNHWNTGWLWPYYLLSPLLKRGTISNTLSA